MPHLGHTLQINQRIKMLNFRDPQRSQVKQGSSRELFVMGSSIGT
jgi:hypothetical protein